MNITGIALDLSNPIIRLVNISAFDLILVNDSGSSSVQNRFQINADLTLKTNHVVTLIRRASLGVFVFGAQIN